MIVGTEWIIDAFDCDADRLRDRDAIREIFLSIIADLKLKSLKETWHQFEGEKGITGMILLTESHLACHTYPEHQTATFNLYCCRERPYWDWETNLKKNLGAKEVGIRKFERGRGETMTAGGRR